MKTIHRLLSILFGLMLLVTACSPQTTPTTAPISTEPPAAIPVTGGTVVNLGQSDALGTFLVDDQGMSLYLYTKDTPNTSTCYDKCATAWPPLLTTGNPVAGEGVDASKFGTTTRTDGTVQVTYNGWPLYYYQKDKAPGDVMGQNVGDVWFVISPAGEMVEPKTTTVNLGQSDALGTFLVDDQGMSLYLYTKDTPNTSTCYDKCATAWPPLLTTGNTVAGEGVDASKFGTTTRIDGTVQVTYNGWPLYYYQKDKAPGDVTGQNVGDVWYVVSAAGEKMSAATINLGQDDTLGPFLIDDQGMSLYLYTKDTPNTSNCYDKCATAWPPLLTAGAPIAGDGVDASKLGTTTRTDGAVQATYNGWPLYYYQKDEAPGDVTGQDVGGVWYVVSAAGDKIETP